MRILSWNVNGIRAADRKGFFDYLKEQSPDILCVQEVKAHTDQLNNRFIQPDGYNSYWNTAEKKGYSGVAVYAKREPDNIKEMGIAKFDDEGRLLILEYPEFVLFNGYFPNSQGPGLRVDYKIEYCDAILELCNSYVQSGRNVLVSGDYNIAHTEIDLARPKQNQESAGFLPEERQWMTKFLDNGYTDTFRMFNKEPGNYTWWTYRFKAREKNIGWRIDYHCVNEGFNDKVKKSEILSSVMGSDHCPISIDLDV